MKNFYLVFLFILSDEINGIKSSQCFKLAVLDGRMPQIFGDDKEKKRQQDWIK